MTQTETTRTGTDQRGGLRQAVHRLQRRYAQGHDRPLAGYAAVLGGYSAIVGLLSGIGRARHVELPEQVTIRDTVLLCLGTHKASRLLAKDSVTSPLRAPFVRYEEPAGEAELNESVRGSGVQHAVGELVTCPFCLAVWVSTGLTAGLVFAPRLTRLVLNGLTAIAVSDTMQLGYDYLKQRLEQAQD